MNIQKINKNPRLPIACIVIFALTLITVGLYIAFRVNMNFADAFNQTVSPIGRMIMAKLTGWMPFSFAEMLLLLSPVRRSRILLAKSLAVLLFGLVLCVAVWLLSVLLSVDTIGEHSICLMQ